MRKVIIRDKRKIPPFNEPARELRVVNKPLWLHQKDTLEPYCDSEVETDFFEQIPSDGYEETLVYRDNLFFDQAFIETFLARARSLGKACRVAFALDDEVITKHALPLQSGIRREGDVYVADMCYFPDGLSDDVKPVVVDTLAREIGFYHIPTYMATEKGEIVYFVPLHAFLSIENWVHVYMANTPFGVLAEGARMEASLDSLAVQARILLHALLERKQFLSCSAMVQVGKNTHVDPTAIIQGPTIIGDNVTIGPGTVITNSLIGNNVNIMQGSQVMLSIVSDGCYLPFRAALFMTTLMEDCMVAQNTCLQLCVVGRSSFVGAGTTFTDLKLLPRTLRTLHKGKLQDTNLTVLGGCVGHNCRVGSGLLVYPARTIESDCIVIRSEERAVITHNIRYEDSDHHKFPDHHLHPRLYPRQEEQSASTTAH
jgi:carbonic anhydrase/acetyltransferase-like protein (isoleucine patch superfamily)